MKSQKKIIIVTGISNVIGQEFMRYYSYNDDYVVIGISRTVCNYGFKNAIEAQIDLLDKQQITASLHPHFLVIPWQNIQECVIIHTAGKSKNDQLGIHTIVDVDNDGIDDEVYQAQLTTFENLHECFESYAAQKNASVTIKVTIVALCSLIDQLLSPIHHSMRSVNNLMRERFRVLGSRSHYHAIILSASTIATEKEVQYRKYADQTYWLHGSEVVDKAIPHIENEGFGYEDIQVYKHHPLYVKYFQNETVEQLIQRFKRETGLS